ncbi:hypothetical protein F5Y04DRAFT_288743 [Hypomontagnella monticulosa]|nr:hypothetical protein F5Y04DRAFT_288743 [Hypomontagnella monticulosa]
MVQTSFNISSTGGLEGKPTRTADSLVWKNIKARDLESSVRFKWSADQKEIFKVFLHTVGPSDRYADLTPLLRQLNLHGYENIQNENEENVHELIQTKVKLKLNRTARDIGWQVPSEATNQPTSSSEEEHIEDTTTRTPSPASVSSRHVPAISARRPNINLGLPNPASRQQHDGGGSKTNAQQHSHPPIEMPKQKPSTLSSTSEGSIKREPEATPPRATSSGESTNTTNVKTEPAIPLFEFRATRSLKQLVSLTTNARDVDRIETSKYLRFQHAIGCLASIFFAADAALKEVENVFGDLPKSMVDERLAGVIAHLRDAFGNMWVDAETVEEPAMGL